MFRLLISSITAVCMCCAANAQTVIEIGTNFVSGGATKSGTLLIQKRWQGKYVVGVGYISPQEIDTCGRPDCQWKISRQFMIGAERLFSWRRLSIGIGLYYFEHVHRISSANLNARSSLEFAVTNRFAVKASHFSNGGTGRTITICNDVTCLRNKFNPGMNTLTLVWRF